jgi:hypothetical protein
MAASSLARRLGRWAVVVPVGLLLTAGAAQGRATVQSEYFQESFSDSVDDTATCLGPGATGTINGTTTLEGQFTDTYDLDPDPGGPRGFRFHGTITTDYRVDYVDGRYIIGHSLSHLEFTDNPGQLRTTSTEVGQDRGTLYDGSGDELGPVVVRFLDHVTYSDTNGNGEPDPGELTAETDRFRISCP